VIGSLRGLLSEISAVVAFLIKDLRSIVDSGLGESVLTSTVHHKKRSSLSWNVIDAVYVPPRRGVIASSYL